MPPTPTTDEKGGHVPEQEQTPPPRAVPDFIRTPVHPRVEFPQFTPATISQINAHLLWGTSQIFLHHFGAGVNEWRLLSRIAVHPGSTAAEASKAIGVNKAIISRTVTVLLAKGCIVLRRDGGARRLYMTQAGLDLYQSMRPIAEEREQIILGGLSAEEQAQLRAFLLRMLAQRPALSAYDAEQLGGSVDDHSPFDIEG